MSAEVLMATPCTNSLGGESAGERGEFMSLAGAIFFPRKCSSTIWRVNELELELNQRIEPPRGTPGGGRNVASTRSSNGRSSELPGVQFEALQRHDLCAEACGHNAHQVRRPRASAVCATGECHTLDLSAEKDCS